MWRRVQVGRSTLLGCDLRCATIALNRCGKANQFCVVPLLLVAVSLMLAPGTSTSTIVTVDKRGTVPRLIETFMTD